MAPDAQGAMKKIPEGVRVEEGRALARLGDGGWDPLVRAGRARRPLRRRARRGGRGGRAQLGRAGGVGDGGAVAAQRRARARTSRAGSRSGSACPTRPCSSASATRPPQREMANSQQQVANVRGQFAVTGSGRRARACWSTTSASAAGRSRWSAASCAGAAAGRSTRSRSRPRSSRLRRCSAISAAGTSMVARGRPSGRRRRLVGANTRQPCLEPAIRPVVPAG